MSWPRPAWALGLAFSELFYSCKARCSPPNVNEPLGLSGQEGTLQVRLIALRDGESGVRTQGPGVSLGTGWRRQALKTEDNRRWGNRQMCGKHLRRGTSHGCADGSCREGVVNEAAGPPAGRRGFSEGWPPDHLSFG